jgi:hypothetical protein
VVLSRPGAQPVRGDLYVLSVGVSRYRNGFDPGGKGQFANLRFPAEDARAVSERFSREGKPLYERVFVYTLRDEQASASAIRERLRWIQERMRPGMVDTAVVFLSGHGLSDDGVYYFAPHDFDRMNVTGSGLSGTELREELGGKLRARAVFLFVDSCHAGGLSGRADDLKVAVGNSLYFLGSCQATEYSFEDPKWGHGAFTLALLRSLRKPSDERGNVRFVNLAADVGAQIERLFEQARKGAPPQDPCVEAPGTRAVLARAQ